MKFLHEYALDPAGYAGLYRRGYRYIVVDRIDGKLLSRHKNHTLAEKSQRRFGMRSTVWAVSDHYSN